MKAFYETPELRWKAITRDRVADATGRQRLRDIQFSMDGEDFAPTNTVWEFTTGILGQLIWTNPSVEVESLIPGMARYNSIGHKYALEALMKQQGWDEIWEQVFTDALAWRGVTMVTTEKALAPRYMDGLELVSWDGVKYKMSKEDEVSFPKLVYIHPDDFFCDTEMRSRAASRRMGHRWVDSLTRLKEVASWDDSYNAEVLNAHSQSSKATGDHDLIEVYQLYVPNYLDPVALADYKGDEKPGEDDLHHGTIYTMVEGAVNGEDLRKPRVYRGPARGPYEVYECVPQPGRVNRAAPLAATWPQIDEAARIGEAVTVASESFKRLAFMTEEMAKAFEDNENDGVVSVGLAPELLQQGSKEVVIGGPSKELLLAKDVANADRDRALSTSDTNRGAAQKGTTATAEDLAASASALRVGLYRNALQRSAERQIGVASWHIEHDDEFVIALPDEARVKGLEMIAEAQLHLPPEMMQTLLENNSGRVAVWTGGDALGAEPVSPFDAQTVKIQAMSMEKISEGLQARRVMQTSELLERILNMQMMFPGFDGKAYAEDMGTILNLPGLGKYMPDAAEQPQQAQMGAAPGVPGTEGLPGNTSGAQAAPMP